MLGKLKGTNKIIQDIGKRKEFIIRDNRFNPIHFPIGVKKK